MTAKTLAKTLYDKIWDAHVVHRAEDGTCLLYIDRHLVHEVTSPQAFEGLRLTGRRVRAPQATVAVPDHNVATTMDRLEGIKEEESRIQVEALRTNCAEFGVELYDVDDVRQGIVHIIGPEQGMTQPGMTIVCGDSHTATHGAFGALAHGIGTSEVEHVLATQTLIQKKSRNMKVEVTGSLPPGVTAKDITLSIIGKTGTAGGTGHVIEYCGEAIRSLSMEGRMTVCNMAIEGGARAGLIAPDETTVAYLKGRPKAPQGEMWDKAVAHWRTLRSDEGAHYDKLVTLDGAQIAPVVTWGTSPEDVLPITGRVPDPADFADPGKQAAAARSLKYMGLTPGTPLCRGRDRHGLHRVVHQRPHRGPARGRQGHGGPPRQGGAARDDRPGLGPRAPPGRGRGAAGQADRGRLRLPARRLLDVPRHEPRPARAGRALRLDLEPELRGPAGPGRAHAPGLAGHGRGGGGHRPADGRAIPLMQRRLAASALAGALAATLAATLAVALAGVLAAAAQTIGQEEGPQSATQGTERPSAPAAQGASEPAVQGVTDPDAQNTADPATEDAAPPAEATAPSQGMAPPEPRWGPVAEELGVGSAICTGDETIVCAVVLCRDGALSLGLIGTGDEAVQPPFAGTVEVDGETFSREMTSAMLNDSVLHVGTPFAADDPLWARMRAGSTARIFDAEGEEAREFSLRGSAAELDRVAAACR